MIRVIFAVLLLTIFAMELCFGFAVVGWQGDNFLIERAKFPIQYWLVMALQFVIAIGVPLLACAAGI